jgi:hypothetical protein
MYDALVAVIQIVELDTELQAIVSQRIDLLLGDGIRDGQAPIRRGNVMVGGCNGSLWTANLSASEAQAFERLCAGYFVYKMQIDVKNRLFARFCVDNVVVPDFLEHRTRFARRHGWKDKDVGSKRPPRGVLLGRARISLIRVFSIINPFSNRRNMSNGDSLRERGNALENQFFAELDAKLLAELTAKVEVDSAIAEFARLTGISDQKVLKAIVALGVTPGTFAALRVFPLVAVAWGDGSLDSAEQTTIQSLASTHLKLDQGPASQLLKSWLEKKPSSDLLAAWETYAKGLVASMPEAEAKSLKETLVEEIQAVAKSSGGLLGWSAVSKGEHEVMNRILAALTR